MILSKNKMAKLPLKILSENKMTKLTPYDSL